MTEQAKDQAEQAPKAEKVAKVLSAEQQRIADLAEKYPALTATFLRGTFKGQLDSVYKDRAVKEEKLAAFVAACRAGDLPLPEKFTASQAKKLAELGLPVSEESIIPSASRGRTADAETEAQATEAAE